MKRISLLICILFFVSSCEIQYDGETKIAVTGKLIDENAIPLSEKDIQVTILSGGGLFSAASNLISYGKSDQNGDFFLIFPAPVNDNLISISINNIISQKSEFQFKEIIAGKNNFENYKLDFDKITLYKNESITNLRLTLNRTSANKGIKDLMIEGKQPNNSIDLITRPQNNDQLINTFYNVVKNQIIVLKYTVIDYSNNGATAIQNISIPIANDAVNYTITY